MEDCRGMSPLSDIAGFPVFLKEDGSLEFGQGVTAPKPEARYLKDLEPVLLYPHQGKADVAYLMYRGTGLEADQKAVREASLRYDITVIFPGTVGSEYIKTFGHYHPRIPGRPWTYPEVYQVLYGRAHFLLQRGGEIDGQILDFAVADFEAGDILIIPPFYGHATVNPGSVPLVLANWVAREFTSIYDPIRLRKGMAYYDVEHKGQSIFMPNDSYESHPRPRLLKPCTLPDLGLVSGRSMYRAWQEGAKLDFLTKPWLYEDLWSSLGVYI